MQLYDQREGQVRFGTCCTIDDLHDARRVAARIGIPHYIVNFERQFDDQVISNFVREYASGRTPIPCVHCNGDLKFATLAERASALDARFVATGHYARVERDDVTGEYRLLRGARPGQGSVVFPLHARPGAARARHVPGRRDGQGDRARARARARSLGIGEARQPRNLLRPRRRPRRLPRAPGRARAGRHDSERSAARSSAATRACTTSPSDSARDSASPLPCASTSSASTPPRRRSPSARERRSNATRSTRRTSTGSPERPPRPGTRVTAQIRHRHPEAAASVHPGPDRTVHVTFDEPQHAVAPGQAVVFYDGPVVLGGGWIGKV